MTTQNMDEAEVCERIATMDREIVVVDTPGGAEGRRRRGPGRDRTADDDAAIAALAERFGVDAAVAEGAVTFHVEEGEAFVGGGGGPSVSTAIADVVPVRVPGRTWRSEARAVGVVCGVGS